MKIPLKIFKGSLTENRKRFIKSATFCGLFFMLMLSVGLNIYLLNELQIAFNKIHYQRIYPLSTKPIKYQRGKGETSLLFIGDSRALLWETDGLSEAYCITKIADGGLTSRQILSRLKEIQIPSCDWIIVQIGINDLHLIKKNGEKDIGNCMKNISNIVDLLVFNKKKIILTTLFPISKIPIKWAYFWDKRQIIDAIKQINLHILGEQAKRGVFVLDTYRLLASENGFLYREFVDNDFFFACE